MSLFQRLGYVTGYITRSRAATKGTPMGNNQSQRIATAVKNFVNDHVGREFTAKELRVHVLSNVSNSAPASADRIMRMLRKQGVIGYTLVSRTKSLYRGTEPSPSTQLDEGCKEDQ